MGVWINIKGLFWMSWIASESLKLPSLQILKPQLDFVVGVLWKYGQGFSLTVEAGYARLVL